MELAPPPEYPERPEQALRYPAWPAWFSVGAFAAALAATLVAIAVLSGVFGLDPGEHRPGVVALTTFVQEAAFISVALAFAAQIARPRAWHFGLRRSALWPGIGWAAAGLVAFYLFALVYGALVHSGAEQKTVEELGGDSGGFGLVLAGIVVICVAPAVEEIFFRGFFYRALRTRMAIPLAVGLDGLVFGIIHFPGSGWDGLLLIVPLGVLGAVLCLVYEQTGSLFPLIGMHAFNNTIAFAAQADGGGTVSAIVGPLMLIACVVVPRLLAPTPRPAPA